MVVGVAEASLLRQPVLDGASRAIPASLGHARWQQQQPHQQQQHERTRQQCYQQQQQQERTIASSESSSFFSDSATAVRFPKSANTVIRSGSALLSYADCSSTSDAGDVRRTGVRKNCKSPIWSHAEISNPWGFATAGPTASLSSWPVRAAVAEAAGEGLKWWERGAAPNMLDVFTTQQFVDALQAAGERLVIVDFFASWCPSCRALFPKLCKIAAEYDDIVFLKVNIDENRQMCKSLNVKVLPYFHIYRGASGRLDTFSCSLSKLQRLKDAISKHHDGPCDDCDPPEVIPEVLSALLVKREDQAKAAAGSSD